MVQFIKALGRNQKLGALGAFMVGATATGLLIGGYLDGSQWVAAIAAGVSAPIMTLVGASAHLERGRAQSHRRAE